MGLSMSHSKHLALNKHKSKAKHSTNSPESPNMPILIPIHKNSGK